MEILQFSSKCVERLPITRLLTYFKPSEMSICCYFLFLSSCHQKTLPGIMPQMIQTWPPGWLLIIRTDPRRMQHYFTWGKQEQRPSPTLPRTAPHSWAKRLPAPRSTERLLLWHTLQFAAIYMKKLSYFPKHIFVFINQTWTLIFVILTSEVVCSFGIQSTT